MSDFDGVIFRGLFARRDEVVPEPRSDVFAEHRFVERQRAARQLASTTAPHHFLRVVRFSTLSYFLAGADSVHVVDLGGGSGWAHTVTSRMLRDGVIATWTVVETMAARQEHSQVPTGGSRHELDALTAARYSLLCDAVQQRDRPIVLYANSSVQYLDDQEILDVVKSIAPDYVVLDDVPIAPAGLTGAWTSQRYFDNALAMRFFTEPELVSLLGAHGLQLSLLAPFPNTIPPGNLGLGDLSQFPEPFRSAAAMTLWFRSRPLPCHEAPTRPTARR